MHGRSLQRFHNGKGVGRKCNLLLSCLNETNKVIIDTKKVKENTQLQLKQESNALELYGKDLTLAAKKGELDPVIGRDQEIQLTIKVLSRRGKNNPVLIGSSK